MNGGAPLSRRELAFLKTVCYSAIFECPLTLDELSRGFLECGMDKSSIERLYRSSDALQRLIECKDGQFYLRGRDHLPELRERRRRFSLRSLERNRWILRLICLIPFTRLVAVSGGAAHLNLEPGDDIDLFLVTRGRRVWSVAVAMLILLRLFRKRRLVCFNYLLSDRRLEVDKEDLFAANQMIHLKPLIGDGTAGRLLRRNPFVSRTYPNFTELGSSPVAAAPGKALLGCKSVLESLLNLGASQFGEWICRKTYRWYLRRRSHLWRTPEEVILNKDVIKLHTFGHRKEVMRRFQRQLEEALANLAALDRSPAADDTPTRK